MGGELGQPVSCAFGCAGPAQLRTACLQPAIVAPARSSLRGSLGGMAPRTFFLLLHGPQTALLSSLVGGPLVASPTAPAHRHQRPGSALGFCSPTCRASLSGAAGLLPGAEIVYAGLGDGLIEPTLHLQPDSHRVRLLGRCSHSLLAPANL